MGTARKTETLLSIDRLDGWVASDTRDQRDRIDSTTLINDLSLEIRAGQTVALVGESGSGKSITALSILRLLEESTPIRTAGSINFENVDLMQLPIDSVRRIRGNRIAMIFQEPMTSLNPLYTIGNQIGESLSLHRNLTKEEIHEETIRLLDRTGIGRPERRIDSYPHELSGGQRQRVMIAMALACRPALLIADEPTTALDVSIQARILDLIGDIKREFQMAMLLITHDLGLVRHFADYIYIMREGAVVECGDPEKIFKSPESDYTVRLIESIPPKRTAYPVGGETLLATENLNCSFETRSGSFSLLPGRKKKLFKAVNSVSLNIRQGTTTGIIGESGSGKSTLAFALLRLLKVRGRSSSTIADSMKCRCWK
jgi:microcin C transport system ATP-binding protein